MAAEPSAVRETGPGDVLDRRYRLVSRLGRGGFGDVWRAEELLPDGQSFREVALKLLSGGFEDVVSWSEEAKLLASFRHPSLVTIYSAGILDLARSQPFVAMELLLGETLSDRIKGGKTIAWRRVLAWARSVAGALDVIHRHGVVHLDLKPANLFLTREGVVKVLDFGIARRSGAPATQREPRARGGADDASLPTAAFVAANTEDAFAATHRAPTAPSTTRRAVVGTPGFMAPEILEGADPTAAADAYALAVVIVQLTTGRLPQDVADEPPWDDATAISAWFDRLRTTTLRGELRDLASDRAGLPRGLVRLLERLLAVDPHARDVAPGRLGEALDDAWRLPHGVADPPYRGLAAYGPDHEGMLFGRDDDLLRLGRELEIAPALLLSGAAGSGRSSLLAAGLAPLLGRNAQDGKDDWSAVFVDSDGSGPDAALASALGALDPALVDAAPEALAAHFAASDRGLCLVVDPLEAFVAVAEEKRRRTTELVGWIASLPSASHAPGLRLLGAVGDEGLAELLDPLPASVALRSALRFMGPPPAPLAREVVAGPAKLARARVTEIDPVVEEVERELRREDASLPVVALGLSAWWGARKRDDGPALSGARFIELGGLRGALVAHAERAVAALGEDDRPVADELFCLLSATDGTGVAWREDELVPLLGEMGRARRVLEAMIAAKLVRRSRGKVSVGHDALLSGWPRHVSARLAAMDRLGFIERLREAAAAWERSGNRRELVGGPGLLAELAGHADWIEGGLSEHQRRFIEASRRAGLARRIARLGAVLVVCALGAVVAWAKWASDAREAADRRARELAEAQAYLAGVVAKSRRTEDPFVRAAWIVEAMQRGAELSAVDGVLALDLLAAAREAPHAHFLTLDAVTQPSLPWDDRWLVGAGPGGTLVLVDLKPTDPQVIDDVDIDADLDTAKRKHATEPHVLVLRPHDEPVVQFESLAFDTSLVTRSVGGEVRVYRLRDNGTVALAAVAPMRCRGAVRTAEAAPVVACDTDDGIARWDMRRLRAGGDRSAFDRDPFPGSVLDVSPDGERVAAAMGRRVLMWAPASRTKLEVEADHPVAIGAWSPRDRVLALVEEGHAQIVDMDRPERPLMRIEGVFGAISARWDDGGVDLALCGSGGRGRWYYLREGGRADDDLAPGRPPCRAPPRGKHDPEPLDDWHEYAAFVDLPLGPHGLAGGWKLPDGRFVTRDFVVFERAAAAAEPLLAFRGVGPTGADEPSQATDSVGAVVRDGAAAVAMQLGPEVRVYGVPDGKRIVSRKGTLLDRCDDGRVAAWRREPSDDVGAPSYRVFDVRSDATLGTVAREPGLVLGVDRACSRLYAQRLDGTIVRARLSDGEVRELAHADGYVYDARWAPRDGTLLLALSSGAVARIDPSRDAVEVVGYATPRATALAQGPSRGEVIFADATGVVVARGGVAERVLDAVPGTSWDDFSVAPDGRTALLSATDRIAVLDLGVRELVGAMPIDNKERLIPWDDDGSVLAWSFGRTGLPEGIVLPRGLPLAKRVAQSVSNLVVEQRRLVLRPRK